MILVYQPSRLVSQETWITIGLAAGRSVGNLHKTKKNKAAIPLSAKVGAAIPLSAKASDCAASQITNIAKGSILSKEAGIIFRIS